MNPSKEERREEFLEVALKLFGEKGYYQTQISDIIQAAGVARGTFYLYFKNKREIFDDVITLIFKKVEDQVETLPRDAFDQIPEKLMQNIDRLSSLLLNEPWIIKILFSFSMGLDKALDERLKKFYSQILDLIGRALKQGQEMGFVRQTNIELLSVALLGSLKELFYQHVLGTQIVSRQRLKKDLFSLVVHAIVKPDSLQLIKNFSN